MDSLGALLHAGKTHMEIEQDVFDTYNLRFREQHARMIWEHTSIGHSFYTNDAGKCTLFVALENIAHVAADTPREPG